MAVHAQAVAVSAVVHAVAAATVEAAVADTSADDAKRTLCRP